MEKFFVLEVALHKNKPPKKPKGKWARHLAAMAFMLVFCMFSSILAGAITSPKAAESSPLASNAASAPLVMNGDIIIALDAGHGGNDKGAIGAVDEVYLTQTTVQFLEEMLAQDPNYTPLLCRPYEPGYIRISPEERAATANAGNADLLISVHANVDASESTRGFECYPQPPGRSYFEQSLRFARLAAEQMQKAGSVIRGTDGVRYLYYTNDDAGMKMMESDHTTVYNLPSLAIVENAACPSVLIEQCFISNPQDVRQFASEEGCRAAAQSYYKAICAYFETQPILA
ncbi:MAG: N-acetylmuramoyl-L-alanine amidase [Oscillospiraceae bacterium]